MVSLPGAARIASINEGSIEEIIETLQASEMEARLEEAGMTAA